MSYRYSTPISILQQQIDSRDFAELLAEERIEPRGVARTEVQFARLMCLIANTHRDPKGSAYTWEDFAAKFVEDEPMEEDAMERLLKMFTVSMGGTVGNNRQSGN